MSSNVAKALRRMPRRNINAIKIDWPLQDQLMGIEIEIDSISDTLMPELNDTAWTMKHDGSLRNGREYVLSQPLSGDLLSKAISSFFSASHRIYRTATGSTHIHVDMMEEETTVESIRVMILLFFMMEAAIFSMYAPEREWCGYTNKLSSAPDALLGAILNGELESELYGHQRTIEGVGRYYGLNIAALFKFGSVEMRYFPTATSVEELTDWLMLAQEFKRAATIVGTVDNLRGIIADERGWNDFLNTFFARWKDDMLRVVPYDEAIALFNKAMAIAASYQINRMEPVDNVNAAVVFSKGRFAKFAKKKIESDEITGNYNECPVLIIEMGEDHPSYRDVALGQVMLYRSRYYVSIGSPGGWIYIDNQMEDILDHYSIDPNVRRLVINRAYTVMRQHFTEQAGRLATTDRTRDAFNAIRALYENMQEVVSPPPLTSTREVRSNPISTAVEVRVPAGNGGFTSLWVDDTAVSPQPQVMPEHMTPEEAAALESRRAQAQATMDELVQNYLNSTTRRSRPIR